MENSNKNIRLHNKFSIRYKFLAVTTILLLLSVSAYLYAVDVVFTEDKTHLVYEYNLAAVKNISSDLNKTLEKVEDKLRLVSWSYDQSENKKKAFIKQILEGDKNIIMLSESMNYKTITKNLYTKINYLKTYEFTSSSLEKSLSEQQPVPFEEIRVKGTSIWNAYVKNGPPLLGMAKTVVLQTPSGKPYKQFVLIAYVKLDSLLGSLKEQDLDEIFVINSSGDILLHPNSKIMMSEKSMLTDKMVKQALSSSVQASTLKFTGAGKKDSFLGAFAKSYSSKAVVISKVSLTSAFAVVDRFISRSLLFAMIVLTITFIAAILFSRSLVRPLEHLTDGMKKVSQGEWDTQIHVTTNDEIEVLATSFNYMIRDLKSSRQQLIDINLNLENKVKDRTLQLEEQNQAVKQAQEALLRTTRLAAVGEIAGQAAHEVLNPLTSIISRLHKISDRHAHKTEDELGLLTDITKSWASDYKEGGFTGLVTEWERPSKVQSSENLFTEDMKNINEVSLNIINQIENTNQDTQFLLKESQRINKIIQTMRSMNMITSEKKQMNIHEVIKDGVNVMADLADELKVEIKLFVNAEDDMVYVDGDEFLQAFTNLLRNSIQAVHTKSKKTKDPHFSPCVVITTLSQGHEIEIQIQDNGVGVLEKNQEKLFNTQFTTKPKSEGTGLGLSISRRFIRAFGGDIYLLNSAHEKGSTFVITLPLCEVEHSGVSA